jgi:hypothetical protein
MRTANATVWIAVFTVVLALVGMLTLYEIVTGSVDTKKLADAAHRQALIAASALCEAQRSTLIQQRLSDANRVAAADNLKATLESSQLDERAWVGIDSIAGKIAVNEPFKAILTLKNNGKTFAKNVRGVGFAEIQGISPIPLKFDRERARLGDRGLMMPNGETTLVVHIAGEGSDPYVPPPTTEIGLKSVESGRINVYIHGRFDYQDVFHKSHWTTFCYHYSSIGWTPCREHNDADENGINASPSSSKTSLIVEPPPCPPPPERD